MVVRRIAQTIKQTSQGEWKKIPPELMVVPILSGQQLYDDYQKADKKQKHRVLTRDLAIFGFTCAGILGTAHLAGKFCAKHFPQVKNNVARIIAAPLGGIIGGVFAGTFVDKFFPIHRSGTEQKATKSPKEIKSGGKTVQKSYRRESKKKKVKNVLTITMTCLGALGGNLLGDKYIAKKKLPFISALPISLGASTLGGLTGFFVSKPFEKNKEAVIKPDNMAFELLFNNSLTVVDGVNIAQQKGSDNRIKKGFYETAAGVVVPTVVVFPVAQMIETNKIDKFLGPKLYSKFSFLDKYKSINKNLLLENAVLLPLTVASILIGRLAGDYVNKRVSDKIIKKHDAQKI